MTIFNYCSEIKRSSIETDNFEPQNVGNGTDNNVPQGRNFFQASDENSIQISQELDTQQLNMQLSPQGQQMFPQSSQEKIQISRKAGLDKIQSNIQQVKERNIKFGKTKAEALENSRKKYLQNIHHLTEDTNQKLKLKLSQFQLLVDQEFQKRLTEASKNKDQKLKRKLNNKADDYKQKLSQNEDIKEIKKRIKQITLNFQSLSLQYLKSSLNKNHVNVKLVNQKSQTLKQQISPARRNPQQFNFQRIASKIDPFQRQCKQQIELYFEKIQNQMNQQLDCLFNTHKLIESDIKQFINRNLQYLKLKLKRDIMKSLKQIQSQEEPQINEQNIIQIQINSRYCVVPVIINFLCAILIKVYTYSGSHFVDKQIQQICQLESLLSHLFKTHLNEIVVFLLSLLFMVLLNGIWKKKFNKILLLSLLFIAFFVSFWVTSNYNLSLNSSIISQNIKCASFLTKYNQIDIPENILTSKTEVQNKITGFLTNGIYLKNSQEEYMKLLVINGSPGVGKSVSTKKFIKDISKNQTKTYALYYNLKQQNKQQFQQKFHQQNQQITNKKPQLMVQIPLIDQFIKIGFYQDDQIDQIIDIIREVTLIKKRRIVMFFDEVNSYVNNQKFARFMKRLLSQVKINSFFKVVIISTQSNFFMFTSSQAITLQVGPNNKSELTQFLNLKVKKLDFNQITNYTSSFRQVQQIVELCQLSKQSKVSQFKLKKCLEKYISIQVNTIKQALKEAKINQSDFCKKKYQILSPKKLRLLMDKNILLNRNQLYNMRVELAKKKLCKQKE